MAWDVKELQTFIRPENYHVVRYLEEHHPPAHSDVAEELIIASKDVPDRRWHCPDGLNCSYIFFHTQGVVYALAVGQTTLAFRLPEHRITEALRTGGESFEQAGSGWVAFNPFRVEIPTIQMRADMKCWCEAAYEHAR